MTSTPPLLHWMVAIATAIAALAAAPLPARAASSPTVSLIIDEDTPKPVQHGIAKLESSLRARGLSFERTPSVANAQAVQMVVAGSALGSGEAAKLIAQFHLPAPQGDEALLIRRLNRDGKPVLLVAGSGARGLMYALLDVAERVAWAASNESPFAEVHDTDEKPYAPERALSIYTFNRAYWESRFYDEAYWTRYLDLLAQNRFDSLVLIFGYENGGFLAPCYPYFFDVEGFPDVRMVGITPDQQKQNLAALNRLIQMAHDRGIKFTAGIWDHIYRGGVQGGGIPGADEATRRPVPGLVWGVTTQNLVPYTKAALAQFVKLVPALDAIQFRMHDESGLKNTEQAAFWNDVFARMKQEAPHLRLDLRAKGLPDSVIQSAIDSGVPFRITTKYWMEQMGLPFHPTHINKENQLDRRHSYADLLKYPRTYKMHWRLWNGGTARLLLWGDPDYVRRFAESSRLYDGDGFEVNEPLCTKMEAQPHDAKPFELLTPSHRYYDYEFERYWHFFQLFGRLGYNTNTPAETWQREFQTRFGPHAGPMLARALHKASWVLPRIVASCYPYTAFPMTRGWPEKQTLGSLPDYAKAQGSDIEQFASFDEEAQLLIANADTAKIRPAANSRWFAESATVIKMEAMQATMSIGTNRNREFDSTITDLQILANLAVFHSWRIKAAVNYRLFERTRDPQPFRRAIEYEGNAIHSWRDLVASAADFYSDDLMMGVRGANLCGHWKDELVSLQKGFAELELRRTTFRYDPTLKPAPRFPSVNRADLRYPEVKHQPITSAPLHQPITVTAEVFAASGIESVRLRFRSVNQRQDYQTLSMLPTGDGRTYQATIPAQAIPPEWDLMYFIEATDHAGNGRIYPDLEIQTPYIIVNLQRGPR